MDQQIASTNGAGRTLERAREGQLRRLLELLEAGGIDAYEYAKRVRAVEAASSPEQMTEIVDAPAPEPTLDAVDLALLARQASPAPDARRKRAMWMAVVAVFFVVLLGMGLWLVSHAHSLNGSGSLGVARPAAAAALD